MIDSSGGVVFKVNEPNNRNFNVTGKEQHTGDMPTIDEEELDPTYYKRTNGRTEDVTPEGKFNPKKPVTRAQMLTILDKMIKHYVVNEETLQ